MLKENVECMKSRGTFASHFTRLSFLIRQREDDRSSCTVEYGVCNSRVDRNEE